MGRLLPAMTQQKLDTQRDVVKNERRWSVDNQPYGTWWEKLPALAFPPIIPSIIRSSGRWRILSEASLEDVAQFFATYYTPDNAVLSIAGDFEPSDARRLVEQYFGPIPRGTNRPPLPSMELPPTFGESRREVVIDAVMLPRLYLAFRSPVFGSDEYYAASVTGAILGIGGEPAASRMVRDRQIASDATAFTFDLPKGSDLLVVDVTARPGIRLPMLLERKSRRRSTRPRDRRRVGGRARDRAHRVRLRSARCSPPATVLTGSRCSQPISVTRSC